MTSLEQTLQQFLAVDQRRRFARLTLRAALLLGCLVAGLWRWQTTGRAMPWMWAAGATGVAVWTSVVWRGMARARAYQAQAAAQLDQALGLQGRLMTAEEFAHAEQPPRLYPLLVDDATRSLEHLTLRGARVWDRATVVLTVLLLVLLLLTLPWRAPRLQMARAPLIPPLHGTPPSTPPPPPPQDQRGDQRDPSSGQGSSGSAGASGQRHQPQQGSGSDQSQSSSQSKQGQGQSSGSGQGNQQQRSGQSDSRQAGAQQQQASGSSKPSPSQEASSRQGAGEKSRSAQHAQRMQPSGESSGSKGGERAMTPGSAELTKADIQQLLKELSGELQQLQDQLREAPEQPVPTPGSSTDPQLYEAGEALEQSRHGAPLPMQLDVDAQATASPRRGSGTGKRSSDADDAQPQLTLEEATLAAQPTSDDTAMARQRVPPEYQPVVERLTRPVSSP